ncbi:MULTISPECIES: hypothetical protein [unclassified Nocardia]|uniref:hypothetical protein n=1 Tax=Nocardia sp. NPDC056541 TaxID=3345860 RepID=UPI00366C1778
MYEEVQGGENGQAPPIKSYDTSIHPNFPVVDSSKFKTIRDFTGELIQANATQAAAVGIYFSSRDRPVAKKLFDHYYRVTGDDYVLEESAIRLDHRCGRPSRCGRITSDRIEAAVPHL